jgi:hypothetical protein
LLWPRAGVDVKVFAVSPGAVATEIWYHLWYTFVCDSFLKFAWVKLFRRWMPRCLRIPFDLFTKLAFLSPEQVL